MEEKLENQNSADRESVLGEGVEETPYVSPEVLAARDGQKVEFGKDLTDSDEEE
jgi:hypothetical protein